jgi:hypothetical protein
MDITMLLQPLFWRADDKNSSKQFFINSPRPAAHYLTVKVICSSVPGLVAQVDLVGRVLPLTL